MRRDLKISEVVHTINTNIFDYKNIIRSGHVTKKSRDRYFKMKCLIIVRGTAFLLVILIQDASEHRSY